MTPMIRLFPPAFKYPLPQPWKGLDNIRDDSIARALEISLEKGVKHWRGLYVVTSALRSCSHKVTEFVVEVNKESVGVDHCPFLRPGGLVYNIWHVFSGLERLDLALNTKSASAHDWGCFREGFLREALAEAHHLKYFSFQIKPWFDPKGIFMDDKYVTFVRDLHGVQLVQPTPSQRYASARQDRQPLLFLVSLSLIVRRVELHATTFVQDIWSAVGG